jgi:glycosyltransferase involved in cell wall biosynthesis
MSAGSPPLVSAIIPARDAARFVADAIDSVLAQTYAPVECIVVDDGSTDDTVAIARDRGDQVVVISQPHRGVSAARNRGAEAASGSLLAFLDADDVWLPERVERMVEALATETRPDAVLCATRVVDSELRPGPELRQEATLDLRSILLCEASLVSASSNLLIRKPSFEALGGFDERLSTAADWALLLRLVDDGRLGYLDEPLTLYRRHEANMSRSVELMEHDMRLVYDELFADPARKEQLGSIRRRAYARLHRVLAGSYYAASEWLPFLRNAALSIANHPAELGYFLALPVRRRRRRAAASPTP